jgi:hypothetical protein
MKNDAQMQNWAQGPKEALQVKGLKLMLHQLHGKPDSPLFSS